MKKIIIILFLLTISTAQAASLGSIQKNDRAEIKPEETAIFTVLFYNDNPPILVTLTEKNVPDEWIVIIQPESFILNQSLPENPPYDEDVEYLNTPKGLIKTYPVRIYIKSPESVEPGEYEIFVSAIGGNPSGGLSVFQERVFKFTVNVTEKETGNKILDITKENINKLTGMASAVTEQVNVTLLFISIFALLVISYVIKRKYF